MSSRGVQVSMGERLVASSSGASIGIGKALQLDGKKILLNAPNMAIDEPAKPPAPKTKIVVTDQDGKAIAFQGFVAKLGDESERTGMTDEDGTADLDIAQSGTIVFSDVTMPEYQSRGEMKPYVVKQGDYLARIAFARGFDADKVWADPKNAELRALRKSPDILYPGDILHVPDAAPQGLPLNSGTTNSYCLSIPKVTLSVRFVIGEAPLASETFVIHGLGAPQSGTTDKNGSITIAAPVRVREVTVAFPNRGVQYPVRIGEMDPIEESSGVRKRLEHLGYCAPFDGESEEDAEDTIRFAIKAFQTAKSLPATGVMDAATTSELLAAHDS